MSFLAIRLTVSMLISRQIRENGKKFVLKKSYLKKSFL